MNRSRSLTAEEKRAQQPALVPTFPGDPAHGGVSIGHDIMLHQARSRMRWAWVSDSCYRPAPRPCPAREAGKEGGDCRDERCARIGRRATPPDREARFIHYEGRNKRGDLPGEGKGGREVYGHASNPDRLIEDRFACITCLSHDNNVGNPRVCAPGVS